MNLPPPPSRDTSLDLPDVPEALDREQLLDILAQQQRLAQAGLATAGLVHDIKNHACILGGFAELALSSGDGEACREALRRVQRQARSLRETTEAFLAFLRRREHAEEDTFDLGTIADRAERLVRPIAAQGRVTLAVHAVSSARVRGDARLAVQAIVNLLSNAIRACRDRGGPGRVHVVTGLSGPEDAYVEVIDDGPGVPAPVRDVLFRPFTTARQGGTGLGLFIVRQITRRLGGRIQMKTGDDGTTFRIEMPQAEASGGSNASSRSGAGTTPADSAATHRPSPPAPGRPHDGRSPDTPPHA